VQQEQLMSYATTKLFRTQAKTTLHQHKSS